MRITFDSLRIRLCIEHMSDSIPVVLSAEQYLLSVITNVCYLIVSIGANQIEMGNGQIINLERLTKLERAGKAKMLLSSPGVIVHRHLMDGDGYF